MRAKIRWGHARAYKSELSRDNGRIMRSSDWKGVSFTFTRGQLQVPACEMYFYWWGDTETEVAEKVEEIFIGSIK